MQCHTDVPKTEVWTKTSTITYLLSSKCFHDAKKSKECLGSLTKARMHNKMNCCLSLFLWYYKSWGECPKQNNSLFINGCWSNILFISICKTTSLYISVRKFCTILLIHKAITATVTSSTDGFWYKLLPAVRTKGDLRECFHKSSVFFRLQLVNHH